MSNCRAHGYWVYSPGDMADTERTTIHIHPLAPAKVAVGETCNGCGVCCVVSPCPLGMVLSGRRSGACAALRWDAALLQYRCGAIVAPRDVLAQALPERLRWLAPVLGPALGPVLRRLGSRWIAAGTGCDSNLEVVPTDVVSTTMPATELLQASSSVVRPPQQQP